MCLWRVQQISLPAFPALSCLPLLILPALAPLCSREEHPGCHCWFLPGETCLCPTCVCLGLLGFHNTGWAQLRSVVNKNLCKTTGAGGAVWGEEVPSLHCAPAQSQAWLRAGHTTGDMMCVLESPRPSPVSRAAHFFRNASFGSASIYPACSEPFRGSELCEEGWPGCSCHGVHPAAPPARAGSWGRSDRELHSSAARKEASSNAK